MHLLAAAAQLGLILLLGCSVLAAVLPSKPRHWAQWLGLGFATGYGLLGVVLFGASLAGAVPSRPLLGVVAALALALAVWKRHALRPPSLPDDAIRASPLRMVLGWAAALLLIGATVNVATRSAQIGLSDIDQFAIWLFKAKVLLVTPLRPIPTALLDPSLSYSHQDYPLGMPLVAASLYAAAGQVDEHLKWAMVLPPYLALMGVLYGTLRRYVHASAAGAITAAVLAGPGLVQQASLAAAEVPLVLLHAGCLVLLLEWAQSAQRGRWRVLLASAAMAAFAAMQKNEGLAMLPVVAVASLVFCLCAAARRRRLVELLLAATGVLVLIGPWLFYRQFLPHTHEDYGGRLSSAATVAHYLPRLASVLPTYLGYCIALDSAGPLWIVLIIAAAIGWSAFRRPAVLLLWGVLLMHWWLYVAIFTVTPWPLDVLMPMVTPKLLTHVAPAAALLIGLHLAELPAWRQTQVNAES